jgi:hypothetical protein
MGSARCGDRLSGATQRVRSFTEVGQKARFFPGTCWMLHRKKLY